MIGIILGRVVFFLDTDSQIVDAGQVGFQGPDIEILEPKVEIGDVVCYPEGAFLEEERGDFGVDLVRGAEDAVVQMGGPFIVFYAAGVEGVFPFCVFGVFFVVFAVDIFPGLSWQDVSAGYEVAVYLAAQF